MKGFYYDTILTRENICNLGREEELLLTGIRQKKKLVVYGPRNYGKSSLMQSAIVPGFKKKHKTSFVFQVDLLEIKTIEALNQRIRRAFEHSFSESFPGKQLFELAKRFLMGLKPSLEIDPITNLPSLSVNTSNTRTHLQWQDIFTTIRTEIAPHYPTLLIFDEFQDIAFIPGIQGEMRQVLEAFRDVPIIILGSKQHILSRIFAQPNAPLAGFGEDLEFKPIPYEEYTEYMNERFAERDLKIGADDSQKLQDLLLRVPEPINITCADLMSRLSDKTIAWQDVAEAIVRVIEGRHTRFERMLSLFSQKEEEVLTAIGKFGPIKYVTGKDFLKRVNCSARAAKTITEKLLDRSFLDKTADGYRVADPLLALFMQRYR